MSIDDLRAEFPIGTRVLESGGTCLYVIGWLENDDLMVSGADPLSADPAEVEARKAGVPAAHARLFKERFTDRERR